MSRKIVWAAVIVIGLAIVLMGSKGKQRAVAGVKDPLQTEAAGQAKMSVDGYDITVSDLYAYDISALVVSTHNYSGSGLRLEIM